MLASYIVLSVTVCTVGYDCLYCGDQIFMYFVSCLSMIIYEVLYIWSLRHNICSAWFIDIRISTCIIFKIMMENIWDIYNHIKDCLIKG